MEERKEEVTISHLTTISTFSVPFVSLSLKHIAPHFLNLIFPFFLPFVSRTHSAYIYVKLIRQVRESFLFIASSQYIVWSSPFTLSDSVGTG